MSENLIYYNKEKVDHYSTLILGHTAEWESAEKIDNDNKASNYLLECAKFEEILQQRDDYFDFTGDSQRTSIKDVRISSIIRVTGEIYVPEQFDMIHLIDEYKPYILNGIECNGIAERELLNMS